MFYLLLIEDSTPPCIIASLYYLLSSRRRRGGVLLYGLVRLLATQLHRKCGLGSALGNVELFSVLCCVCPRWGCGGSRLNRLKQSLFQLLLRDSEAFPDLMRRLILAAAPSAAGTDWKASTSHNFWPLVLDTLLLSSEGRPKPSSEGNVCRQIPATAQSPEARKRSHGSFMHTGLNFNRFCSNGC